MGFVVLAIAIMLSLRPCFGIFWLATNYACGWEVTDFLVTRGIRGATMTKVVGAGTEEAHRAENHEYGLLRSECAERRIS